MSEESMHNNISLSRKASPQSDRNDTEEKAIFLKSGDNTHLAWLKHLATSTVSPLVRKTTFSSDSSEEGARPFPLPSERGWD
jgi:hypothetical protein